MSCRDVVGKLSNWVDLNFKRPNAWIKCYYDDKTDKRLWKKFCLQFDMFTVKPDLEVLI